MAYGILCCCRFLRCSASFCNQDTPLPSIHLALLSLLFRVSLSPSPSPSGRSGSYRLAPPSTCSPDLRSLNAIAFMSRRLPDLAHVATSRLDAPPQSTHTPSSCPTASARHRRTLRCTRGAALFS
eukprot:2929112-Pleurochrysis_carterae.AAC.1